MHMTRRFLMAPLVLLIPVGCGPRDKGSSATPLTSEVQIQAGGDTTIKNRTSGGFTVPAANLNDEEFARHGEGDVLFEGEFVIAPSPVRPGLGPTFSNTSCRGCHVRNGRGMPALGENGTLRSPM